MSSDYFREVKSFLLELIVYVKRVYFGFPLWYFLISHHNFIQLMEKNSYIVTNHCTYLFDIPNN